MDAQREDRSIGQLFGELSRQITTLIRQEFELARTEITGQARAFTRDGAMIGAGGALAYAGLLFVLGAVVALLVQAGLDLWLAALIVGVVVLAIGGALVWQGREGLRSSQLVPERTIETLKDDAEWAKEQIK